MTAPDDLAVGQAITRAAETPDRDRRPPDPFWWSGYGDPQLDHLVALLDRQAPGMALAAARLRRAEAMNTAAGAVLEPAATLSATTAEERFPNHSVYSPAYAGKGGSEGRIAVDVRYHLDFWGKRAETAAAAGARVAAARAEAEDARLLLRTGLVEAYLRLDAAIRLRDIAVSGLVRREGLVDLLVIRTSAGLSTDLDAVASREAVTETRDGIVRLEAEIATCRHRIAALLGLDPAFADTLSRPALRSPMGDPLPLSSLPASLLGRRPDVAVRRAEVEAAAHEIGVARAGFYPDVDLLAFAGPASLGLAHLLRSGSVAAGVGPAVTLPVFDGGLLRSGLAGRMADFDAAVAAYDEVIATALRQIADGVVELRAWQARKTEAVTAFDHWSRAVALTEARERQGLSAAGDRLSAETALLLSRRRVVEAETGAAIARVGLIRALGGAFASRVIDVAHDIGEMKE